MFMKAIGSTTRLMDLVLTFTQMEQFMKDNGLMTNRKATEKKYGLMEVNLKVNTRMVKNMEEETSFGQMEQTI